MKNNRSHEEWKNQVDNYIKSGLSINGYCRENKLAPSTFYYWLKKIRNPSEENPKKLVKLAVPIKTNEKMKLYYNDITLEFPMGFSTDKISKLISALKEV